MVRSTGGNTAAVVACTFWRNDSIDLFFVLCDTRTFTPAGKVYAATAAIDGVEFSIFFVCAFVWWFGLWSVEIAGTCDVPAEESG